MGFVAILRRVLVSSLAAAVLAASLDAVVLGLTAGAKPAVVWVVLFGLWAAFGISLGLVCGPIAWALSRFRHPVRGLHPSHVILLAILALLGLGFVFLNRPLFSGPGVTRSPVAALIPGILTGLFAFGLWWTLRLWINTRDQEPSPTRRWRFAFFLAAGGCVVFLIDRQIYRGLYPLQHMQMIAVGLFLLMCAFDLMSSLHICRRKLDLIILCIGLVAALNAARLLTRPDTTELLILQHAKGLVVANGLLLFVQPDDLAAGAAPPGWLTHPKNDADTIRAKSEGLKSRGPHHLVLISIDTVRADHVGFLKPSPRNLTPTWDQLASESVVFTQAYTPYPTSSYAFSGLFDSRFPAECRQRLLDIRRQGVDTLPHRKGPANLAATLRLAGWRTAAITSFVPRECEPGGAFSTLPEGFAEFLSLGVPRQECDAETITRAAHTWLLEHRGRSEPAFLWVHYFDPHHPYRPRPGFNFGTSRKDLYAGEIAHVDRSLKTLIEGIDEVLSREKTLLVIHSDHGEAFAEHGTDFHSSSLYNEQVHVPLTLRMEGIEARRFPATVSLLDLLPTTLSLLGVNDPGAALRRGRDWSNELQGLRDVSDQEGWAFAQLLPSELFRSQSRTMLVRNRRKVIVNSSGIVPLEYYDLEQDPAELANRRGQEPANELELRRALRVIKEMMEKP